MWHPHVLQSDTINNYFMYQAFIHMQHVLYSKWVTTLCILIYTWICFYKMSNHPDLDLCLDTDLCLCLYPCPCLYSCLGLCPSLYFSQLIYHNKRHTTQNAKCIYSIDINITYFLVCSSQTTTCRLWGSSMLSQSDICHNNSWDISYSG